MFGVRGEGKAGNKAVCVSGFNSWVRGGVSY